MFTGTTFTWLMIMMKRGQKVQAKPAELKITDSMISGHDEEEERRREEHERRRGESQNRGIQINDRSDETMAGLLSF